MKRKYDVKPGDIIHIYRMIGEPQYTGREGTVRHIDDIDQIHGTWGGLALTFDDDWIIMEDMQ